MKFYRSHFQSPINLAEMFVMFRGMMLGPNKPKYAAEFEQTPYTDALTLRNPKNGSLIARFYADADSEIIHSRVRGSVSELPYLLDPVTEIHDYNQTLGGLKI